MVNLSETPDRAALDAARAEGRTEGAEAIRKVAARWLVQLTCIAEREFVSDAARDVVERFSAALVQTLEQQIERYRRDQSHAIARYCEHTRRRRSTPPPAPVAS